MNLREMTIHDLLLHHRDVEKEFKRRGVAKKLGGVVGGYTEELVRRGLLLCDRGHNEKHVDAEDPRTRETYQIKGRNGAGGDAMLGAIGDPGTKKFDFLVGVIFNGDYTIRRAAKVPHLIVREVAKPNSRGSYNVTISNDLVRRKEDGVCDITDDLTPHLGTVGTPPPPCPGGDHHTCGFPVS